MTLYEPARDTRRDKLRPEVLLLNPLVINVLRWCAEDNAT